MVKLSEMKTYIINPDNYTCFVFEQAFRDFDKVEIIYDDIEHFYSLNHDIDCLVSPANSFGYMTGGYDAALSRILGKDLQQLRVQQYIKDHYYGEQVVGSSFYIKTDIPGLALIHTPTMRYPKFIKDNMIVYYCMRSTLMCALENNVKTIVIPVFGGDAGGVDPDTCAKRMAEAYNQVLYSIGSKFAF